MKKNISYVIITPVRDEEDYIEKTISSIISQTIKPAEWIIVNDGSTDNTGKIIDKYANKYKWIKTVHRKNRGFRKAGGGVIEAFYDGYNKLSTKKWQFLVKLDGDLSFDKDYFEKCFREFNNTPNLGIGGGIIWNSINGKLVIEKDNPFHVRGATKIYKRDCWNAIGILIKAPGWDTLDEIKANMLGWQTKCFMDIKLVQHKVTGSADGTWTNWVKNGRANYISGYHPLFMILKCIKRLSQKPYFIVSFGLFWGFISGYLHKIQQIDNRKLVEYLRKQQINKIFGRKSIWQ